MLYHKSPKSCVYVTLSTSGHTSCMPTASWTWWLAAVALGSPALEDKGYTPCGKCLAAWSYLSFQILLDATPTPATQSSSQHRDSIILQTPKSLHAAVSPQVLCPFLQGQDHTQLQRRGVRPGRASSSRWKGKQQG